MKGIVLFLHNSLLCNVILNPLPGAQNLESSNSAANRDMMSKIWTNGDTII